MPIIDDDMVKKANSKLEKLFLPVVLVAVIAVLVAVLTVVVSCNGGIGGLFPKVTSEVNKGGAVIAHETVKNFKISTLTYHYTNVVHQDKSNQVLGFDIPFTRSFLFVKYDGVVEIGIDGKQITIEESEDTLTVTLPPAQILAHTQVKDSTRVIVDESGLFNENKVSDYIELFDENKADIEAGIAEGGMFEEASQSAQEQLTNLFSAIPDIKDNYKIVFVQAEA